MNGETLWRRHTDEQTGGEQTCPDLLDLAGYIDGKVSPSQRDAIEQHLSRCNTCLEHVMALRIREAEPVSSLDKKTVLTAKAHITPRTRPVNNPLWRPVQQIAAGLLLVVVSLAGYRLGTTTCETNEQVLQVLLNEEIAPLSTLFERTPVLEDAEWIGGTS